MYLNIMDTANIRTSLLLLISIFSFLSTNLTSASDTISLTHPLSANQTIISHGGTFELGFFTPGNSSHNYYIGIWYKNIPKKTVVWVANREAPIPNPSSAELTISGDGNLVLLNQSKIPVWSSNSTPINSNSAVAVLLDTGNLVLRNGSASSTEIWQSFAHPTDTWMPGGWLGVDKLTGDYQSLTSWKSSYDPSPGPFSQSMDPDGSNQYVLLWNGTQIYWSSGLWINNQYFSNVPGTKEQTVFNFTFVDDKQRKYATYTITKSSVTTRFVIGPSGQGKQWLWMDSSQEWSPIFTQPLDQCDVFAVCGAFGVCEQMGLSFCSCSIGFQPTSIQEWDVGVWNSGCVRKTQLKCATNSSIGGEEEGFAEMQNMQLPANSQSLKASNSADCRDACLNNCSCIAYAYYNGCSIWTRNLMNLRQLYDGDSGASTLHLRLAAVDLPSSSSSHRTVIIAITASVAATVLMILCVVLGLICMRRQRTLKKIGKQEDGSLIRFRYTDLQRMTKNFSDVLGNGGFGSVYKGTMQDSTAIAVKKLNGFAQGDKQFRTEVSTLGSIQHVSLVRLLGFCSQGSERLLVYEYMPGGSLNSHLFGDGSSKPTVSLDWRMRYQIILGTARGLAYLHEQCRERIIHCDVKPHNILLDDEFRPKVADFGMAKIIGHEFSRVLTTMRGTVGYIAPEWISGLSITAKVDVYSFGMMLFEVVSGRRNADVNRGFFPSWAARQVIEGNVESLLDARLEGDAEMEEVSRVSKVACWCIQDSEEQRPSMGQVVQILEGRLEVNTPPMPMALQHLAMDEGGGESLVFYHAPSHEDQDTVLSQGLNQ